MHKNLFILTAGLILLILLVCSTVSATTTDKDTIDVSGTGTIKIPADQVEISLAVVTKGSDVGQLQIENAEKMNDIISGLKSDLKISNDEISTSHYSVSEEWNPSTALKATYGEDVQIYRVSNTITVVTRNVDKAGDIIDVAITNGANSVDSLQFSLTADTRKQYRQEALQIAVEKTKEDANAVVKALGRTLGQAAYIQIGNSYVAPWNQIYASKDSAAEAYDQASTPIQAGLVEVSASVSITYVMV
jgi:uncharacterized protein YggE